MNKLRHGQEITSEVINSIINEINSLAKEHDGALDDKKETIEKLNTFQATLEELKTEYTTKLAKLPNFIELVETYYSQLNDGVNFKYISNNTEDTGGISPMYKTDFLVFNDKDLCAEYKSKNNPPENIKTLLIDTAAKIIWFYDLSQQTWISLSADVNRNAINVTVPAISIVEDPTNLNYGKWQIGNNITSISALGTEGPIGPIGPMGAAGEPGPRGVQGPQGPQGIKGNDGRTIAVIAGSCKDSFGNGFVQNNYTNPYLYIKFYYSDASQAEIASIKPIIIKTKGIAYVPYIQDGKLYFSIDSNVSNASEGYNILGQKGDPGEKGEPATFYFKDDAGNIITPERAADTSDYDYCFDAKQFKGPKGDQGIQGATGPKGTDGIGIKNIDVASSTEDRCVKVTIIKDNEDMKYFEIPYGKDGANGINGRDGRDGRDGVNGSDGVGINAIEATPDSNYTKVCVKLSDNSTPTFYIPNGANGAKGDKGDKGEAGKDGLGISTITSAETFNGVLLTISYSNGTVTTVNIPKGPKGDKGATGATGPQGPAGTSLVIRGSVNTQDGLPSDAKEGECYIVLTDTSREKTEYGVLYYKTTDGWQYCGQIKGPKGDQGIQGIQGPNGTDGISILSITHESTSGKEKTYKINYSNENESFFTVTDGADGVDGITPHIDTTTKKWFIGDSDTGVIAEGLQGKQGDTGKAGTDGREVTFKVEEGYVKWKYVGETTWNNLISVEELKGEQGIQGDPGIQGGAGPRGKGITEISSDKISGGNTITITYDSDDPDKPNTHTFTVANGSPGSAGTNGTKVVLLDQNETPSEDDYEINDVVILNAPNSTAHGNMYRLLSNNKTKYWKSIGQMKGATGETGQRGSQFFKINSSNYTPESTSITKSNVLSSEKVLVGDILIDLNSQMFKVISTSQANAFEVLYLVTAQGEKGATGNNGKSFHVHPEASPPETVDKGLYTKGDTVLCLTANVAKIFEVLSVTAKTDTTDTIIYKDPTSIRGADGKTIKFVTALPTSSPDPDTLYIVRGIDAQPQPIRLAKRNSNNTQWEFPLNFNYCTSLENIFPLTSDGDELGIGPAFSGGTKVTLNGLDEGASIANFYAPVNSGTSGQILKSGGDSSTPTWVNPLISTVNGSTTTLRNIYAPSYAGGNGQILKSSGYGSAPTWVNPLISTVNGSTTTLRDIYAPVNSGTSGQILKSGGDSSTPTWVNPLISTVNGSTTTLRNIYAPTNKGKEGSLLFSTGKYNTPAFNYPSTLFDIKGLYYANTSYLNVACDNEGEYTLFNNPEPSKIYLTPFFFGDKDSITIQAGSKAGVYQGVIIFSSVNGSRGYAFSALTGNSLTSLNSLQGLAGQQITSSSTSLSGLKGFHNSGLIIWWFIG